MLSIGNVFIMSIFCYLFINSQGLIGGKTGKESKVRGNHAQ